MTSLAAGIDIGGTRIKSVLLGADGVPLVEQTHPTPPDLATRFGEGVATVLRDLIEAHPTPPATVGVAVPGLVDEAAGMAAWSANLGWRDLDVPAALSAYTDLPVTLGHDVRCGLLAEHRLGAAQRTQHALFLTLGTGIASALLCDGRPVVGAAWSGEIGHVVVRPRGLACHCGKFGCLETVASASAIARHWQSASGLTGDAEHVATLVAAGDPTATGVWRSAITALADAIAPVVSAAGSQTVVVGGGLVRSGALLIDPLQQALTARLGELAPVQVVPADLGDRAGALGAALLGADRRPA